MYGATNRVIALVDMDCFYVQVEQRKNPQLLGKPCAVVQYNTWRGGGIIAVGYEARKFGVNRQMRGDEARTKCPEIQLVHVPENRGKADLTHFREAGAEVIDVLATFTDCLERASIDEAYLDLTDSVKKEMDILSTDDVAALTFRSTHIVGLNNLDDARAPESDFTASAEYLRWLELLRENKDNYRIALGAVLVERMRVAVRNKTGFTCSAGVGHNKMLAKLVAGFHKPSQQTLVIQDHVSEMFKAIKISKVRSLGGKLGAVLEDEFKAVTMSDLLKLSKAELQAKVGEKSGDIVYWLCRGVDHEPVRVRQLPKSVGCSKNFMGKSKLKTKAEVQYWLAQLSDEICERLLKEREMNSRTAHLLIVGFTNEAREHKSRSCPLGRIDKADLEKTAFTLLSCFNKAMGEEWHPALINLNMSASKFEFCAGAGASSSKAKQQSLINFHASRGKAGESASGRDPLAGHLTDAATGSSTAIRSTNDSVSGSGIRSFFHSVKSQLHTEATEWKEGVADDPSCDARDGLEVCKGSPLTSGSVQAMEDVQLAKVGTSLCRASGEASRVPCEGDASRSFADDKCSASGYVPTVKPPASGSLPPSSLASSFLTKRSTSSIFSRFSRRSGCKDASAVASTSARDSVPSQVTGTEACSTFPLGVLKCSPRRVLETSCSSKEESPTVKPGLSSHCSSEDRARALCDDTTENITTCGSVCASDLTNCERCGKRLLVWDLPEHMDFHFAKDVQDSLRSDILTLYGNSSQTSSPQRKKARLGDSTLTKYFSRP